MILYKNYLDKEFCKGIIKYCEGQGLEDASVGVTSDHTVNTEVRRSKTYFIQWPIYNSPFLHDLYFNMEMKLKEANNMMYGFQLYSFEAFQFTKYEAEDEGFYDWHVDSMGDARTSDRKLSFSVLLNDTSEFEGGEFEFRNPFNEKLSQAGDTLIFPSFEEHKVNPVTKGTRYSLVGWMRGPYIT